MLNGAFQSIGVNLETALHTMTKCKQWMEYELSTCLLSQSLIVDLCGDISSPVDGAFVVAGGFDPSAVVAGLLSAVAESDGTWD